MSEFSRTLPAEVIEKIRKYRTPYRSITTQVVFRETGAEGMGRLKLEHKWHGSTDLNLSPGTILAILNNELPAVPNEGVEFYRVTEPGNILTPDEAKIEWEKYPFKTPAFAKRHGYFPYVVDNLEPLTRSEFLDQYFQEPDQATQKEWIEMSRKLSQKSNCNKRQFGAMIIQNGRVVAVGNNYPYKSYPHEKCDPCLRENVKSGTRVEACTAIHAEQQVIINSLNKNLQLMFAILTVAGQEPDGRPFINPAFYCTVCSRIIEEVDGILGVITAATQDSGRFRFSQQITDESFTYLQKTL
jgi:dCMP deaminase